MIKNKVLPLTKKRGVMAFVEPDGKLWFSMSSLRSLWGVNAPPFQTNWKEIAGETCLSPASFVEVLRQCSTRGLEGAQKA